MQHVHKKGGELKKNHTRFLHSAIINSAILANF